jgi:hypothetical protein
MRRSPVEMKQSKIGQNGLNCGDYGDGKESERMAKEGILFSRLKGVGGEGNASWSQEGALENVHCITDARK